MLEFLDKPGVFIVLLLVLVVFGAKRLPDSARALGKSMRILKAEAKGLKDDDKAAAPAAALTVAPAAVVPSPAPVADAPLTAAPVTVVAPTDSQPI